MMTGEQLQAIRERAEDVPGSSFATTQGEISQAFFDRATLLREVDQLRKMLDQQNEALAVMHEVAAEHQRREWEWKAKAEALQQTPAGTMYSKCDTCGINHDPHMTCTRQADGSVLLTFTYNEASTIFPSPANYTDTDLLACPNEACGWRGPIEEAQHASGTGTFHCPLCIEQLVDG